MNLEEDHLAVFRKFVNSELEDPYNFFSHSQPTSEAGVTNNDNVIWDNSGKDPKAYPAKPNFLFTECAQMDELSRQVAVNALYGHQKSIKHCRKCKKCGQRLAFLEARARNLAQVEARNSASSSMPVIDIETDVSPTKLTAFIESLLDKTVSEGQQLFAQAKHNQTLCAELQWLKFMLNENM